MLLTTLCTGEEVHRYQKSIVINFNGPKKVLSTSPHNGGLREDLTAVFNNDCTVGAGMAAALRAPTYAEHMALLSRELGLDDAKTAGIGTAAQMENVSIQTRSYKEITVTAVVTGGVEVNGGRVGDPATWDELAQQEIPKKVPHGTINIILFINADLTCGALVRSLVTCTEAKTAALQELLAPSRYSSGIATGSGTDGTIIVADAGSSITLDNAGKHCKLGELIGKAVKAAVKEALFLQTGLCEEKQHDVLRRVDRFGISRQNLWDALSEHEPAGLRKAQFHLILEGRMKESDLVVPVGLYAHLLDQLDWGLITPQEVLPMGGKLLQELGVPAESIVLPAETDKEEAVKHMAGQLKKALVKIIKSQMRNEGTSA